LLDPETRGRIRELYAECLAEAEHRLAQIGLKSKYTKPSVVKVLSSAFDLLSLIEMDTGIYLDEEIEDEHYFADPSRFEIHLVENDNSQIG